MMTATAVLLANRVDPEASNSLKVSAGVDVLNSLTLKSEPAMTFEVQFFEPAGTPLATR